MDDGMIIGARYTSEGSENKKENIETNMEAVINQIAQHYYTMTMGTRALGGTNKQALARYAKKCGYSKVRYIYLPPETGTVYNTSRGWE